METQLDLKALKLRHHMKPLQRKARQPEVVHNDPE